MDLSDAISWCGQLFLDIEYHCLSWASRKGLIAPPVSVPVSLSPSLPLSGRQDDEALASSSSLIEQHACSEEPSHSQGPEPPQDFSSDLVPTESISRATSSPSTPLASDGQLSASELGQRRQTEGAPAEGGRDFQGKEGLGGGRTQGVISADLRGGGCRTEESGGRCFYVGIYTPSSSPPALSPLGSRESHPSEQSLSEEPAELQGVEQNQKEQKNREEQNNQQKIDALPAFVLDGLDFPQQFPLEEQSDLLRCEEGISKDKKEGQGSGASQEVNLDGVCLFETLDYGCLFEILCKLPSADLKTCSLVSHQWLEVSNSAWRRLTLLQAPQVEALPSLVSRFSRLQHLRILEEAAAVCPDTSFVGLVARLSQLRHIYVNGCMGLSDVGLAAILRGCPGLRFLVLEKCGEVTGRAFQGVHCKLEALLFEFCGATNEGLIAIAEACPRLNHLTLKLAEEGVTVSLDAGLAAVAKHCNILGFIELHTCGVSDRTMKAIGIGCPELHTFSLSHEHVVTDAGVAAFTSRLRKLEHLSLFDCNQVRRVPHSGPGIRLKTLSLGWLQHISDEALRQVTREESLEELRIYGCPALSDLTVEKALSSCSRLERLYIANNDSLTVDSVMAYLKYKNRPAFEIKECKGIPVGSIEERFVWLFPNVTIE